VGSPFESENDWGNFGFVSAKFLSAKIKKIRVYDKRTTTGGPRGNRLKLFSTPPVVVRQQPRRRPLAWSATP
jgi:hypothetical protein